MTDETGEGLRDKLTRQGEDAIGKLAQDMLENPLINGALTRAFEAREKAAQAQEMAMGALNIPSASDIERLTRRVRSVSQRLEGIEDGVDRLDDHVKDLSGSATLGDRLERIEEQLAALARELSTMRETVPDAEAPLPVGQERSQRRRPRFLDGGARGAR